MSAAVPTVWLSLMQHLEQNNLKLSTLKRVLIGGSAVPRAMIDTFERVYGIEVVHAWGMTEMSPRWSTLGVRGSRRAITACRTNSGWTTRSSRAVRCSASR